MTRKLGIALAITVVALAGCGGDGGGRPSVDDISKVLTDGVEFGGEDVEVPEEQADCIAKVFHDSDLSDDALNAIVEKDDDYDASDKDEEALVSLTSGEDKIACATPS